MSIASVVSTLKVISFLLFSVPFILFGFLLAAMSSEIHDVRESETDDD